MKNSKLLLGLSGFFVLVLQAGSSLAATAGYAQFVVGEVTLTTAAGARHALQKGEAINEGDTVSTSRNASAQIRMQDGGFIAVRPDTQLKFDNFVFTGKTGAPERSFFSLFRGGFRAVTGLIGRINKQDYRITTPVATIGVRGTDHESIYLPTDIPGALAGAYSKVNIGETSLTTNRGTVNVLPNQMGFAGGLNQAPQLRPINTVIFTVAAAPTKTIKESEEEAQKESDKASVAQKQQVASGEGNGKPEETKTRKSEAAGPVRAVAVVDNTKLAETVKTTVATTSVASESKTEKETLVALETPVTVLPVKASTGGLKLDVTAETVTSGNTTVSIEAGVYSVQAQTAAAAAQSAALAANSAKVAATNANTTLQAITTVDTAPATTAKTTSSNSIATATPLVTAALALPSVSAGAAPTTAQTEATTAASQSSTAVAAFTANGAFADSTAAAAKAATETANTALQSANTTLQTSATTVTTENTNLTNARTAANTALISANSNLTAATNSLNTATTQNSIITTAQSAAGSLLSNANAAAAAADAAALAAQAAATQAETLQSAGDLTGAAAQLLIAQQQLAIARDKQAIAQAAQAALAAQLANAQAAQTAGNAAVTNAVNAATSATNSATTAQTQAGLASSASTAANNALATITTQSGTITSNAAIVNTNAPIAAYNNPAVVSTNFLGHFAMPVPRTGGGFDMASEYSNTQQANTTYVLDGNGNLVEMRSTAFAIQPVQSAPTTSITNADMTWSGGTAADAFKLADNSIYFGRWVNPTITVTDLSNSTVTSYTPASSMWGVLLTPNVGYVQSLIGTTTYVQAGAVAPFDTVGNVGTLNSATLVADFTNQLVNAALNLTMPAASGMDGTYAITANGMAINTVATGQGYGGFGGNIPPTVTCTGTCAAGAGGYSADVGGTFAGSAAASVALGYNLWPTVAAGLPVPDLVQGGVAFNTATPAPDHAYVANHIAVETAGGGIFGTSGGGNLVRPADLVYVTGGGGNVSASGALQSLTFSDIGGGSGFTSTASTTGGTPSSANAPSYASTGIQYGAWTGYTGQSISWSTSLGGKYGRAPSAWMYGPSGYIDAAYMSGASIIGAMAGTFTYQLDGATAPTSIQSGLTGVMNSATVTADFANMLVSASLDLTMPGNENWGASITNASIALGMGALNVTPVVTYSVGAGAPLAACATCSGNMSANFTGQNLTGIIASYDLYNDASPGSSKVSGTVALTRNFAVNANPVVTDGTPVSTGSIEVATAGENYSSVQSYPLASSTTTGNLLTAFGSSGAGFSNMTTVNCTTCTTTPTGQVATSGIYYGTWDAGTYDQFYSSTYTAGTMPPSYWITGPETGPLYLPQALTGTASYTFDSGQVSNGDGVAGTVAGTTTLSLDFNKQAVGINLDFTVTDTAATPVAHTWNVSTAGATAPLGNGAGIGSAAFRASTFNNGGSALLTVSVDGGTTPVDANFNANVKGQLTGVGLNGAIIGFDLNGLLNPGASQTFEYISGVAAFTGTLQNTATSHRYVAASFYDPFTVVPQPMMGLYDNNTARVTQDVAGLNGNLTQFDTQFISGNGGASMIFASNTSTVIDQGSDAVTGISWGRWAGGTVNATDRITGGVIPVTQSGSLHWIAESAATSATTLPVVGTYTYVNAGGTTPTDNLGNSGTLNSATLTADFTAHTVNMGVNVTVNGATLDAVGANVPIIQRTVFYASSQEPAASTSHLNVTCTGTCGATLGGTVVGKFSGAGAIGAAMTYGLQNGSNVVSGVTAFHQ